MTRLLALGLLSSLASIAAICLGDATAHADPSATVSTGFTPTAAAFNPDDAVAPISTVEGPGVKIGEGTVLRPVFGLETGYISNVFYSSSDPTGSGVLRLLAQIGIGSLGADRLRPIAAGGGSDGAPPIEDHGALQYRADLRASYDEMLSGNSTVRSTGGLGLGASFHGLVNPSGKVSFGIDEDYSRLIRAANFETNTNTNRDINTLQLKLFIAPPGRSFSGYLYYANTLDLFERSDQSFADRMFNRVGVHPMWQLLPQTQIYLDVSIADVTGVGSDGTKVTSYPLNAIAGLSTLLSLKTTLNLQAGYTNGFYQRGPNFSAPLLGAQLGYRYSPLGRVTVAYQLQYDDSINANYYRDHIIQAALYQQLAAMTFFVQPELHFRQYNGTTFAIPGLTGPDTRNDTIFAVTAGVQYNFRDWIGVNLSYRFSTVQTDYRYTVDGATQTDPSYTRHEVLLGVRAAL